MRTRTGRNLQTILLSLLFLCLAWNEGPAQSASPRSFPIILISLDGFRNDYLENTHCPNLRDLADSGVRAKWMVPSFPTKTFPNHYTIVTGLYPENHGIVSNTMYDPEFDAVFGLWKREEVINGR